MITPIPLTTLVSLAREGDAQAWRRLVERMYPWALCRARRTLPPGFPAEDAAQEAFCTAFCKLDALRSAEAFPTWLATIIHTHCMRLLNSHPPEISLEQDEVRELLPASGIPSPEDALCTRQMLDAFEKALESLPGRLREVCRLHYRFGLPIAEVAAACALPEGTVKKRLFAARPLLQERMARFRCDDLFRVGYMPVSDHLLAMCADALNQGRGLPLLSRRYLSWSALAGDLERGRLDAAFIMAPLALHLRQAGVPLLYVMDGHHNGSAISLSRNGRREWCMGLPNPHSTHRVLLHRLTGSRPELSGLPVLMVNPSSMASSMRHAEINSFFCAEPWSAKCLREGMTDTVLRSRDILPGHLCCILAVRREFAERRDHVLVDYLHRLLAARDRVRRDPGYGAEIQSAYTGIAPDIARRVLEDKTIDFDDLQPAPERMDAFAGMAREAGVLDGSSALDGFSCPDFFARASA